MPKKAFSWALLGTGEAAAVPGGLTGTCKVSGAGGRSKGPAPESRWPRGGFWGEGVRTHLMFLISLTAAEAFHRQLELNANAAATSSERQLQVGAAGAVSVPTQSGGAVSPLPQPCSHHPKCLQSLAARGHTLVWKPHRTDGQTD